LLATNISSAFYVGQAVARHMIRAARARSSTSHPCRANSRARYRALHGHEGSDQEPDPRHVHRLGQIWPPDQRDRAGLLQDPAQPGAGRQSGILNLAREADPAARWGNVEELVGAACSCPARLRPSSTDIRSMSMAGSPPVFRLCRWSAT
jgi:gluconate 5-dehydrogenase